MTARRGHAADDGCWCARRRQRSESVVAFERLTAIALDRNAPVERRLTALSALDTLPEKTLRPVFDALASDPARTVVARVVRRRAGALLSLEDLIERGAPQDPRLVQAALEEEGATVRVTVLRALVEAARAAERAAPAADAAVWLAVRGQAHQALASRTSRIALYDVREALERGPHPLPVGFLAAAASIGDVSCLLPLAAAWIAAAGDERWWRDHLAEAFASIVKREKIRRRDPALRKILERWPQAGTLVATARERTAGLPGRDGPRRILLNARLPSLKEADHGRYTTRKFLPVPFRIVPLDVAAKRGGDHTRPVRFRRRWQGRQGHPAQ